MTRAFSAIGHGHFAQAWAIHPFSFPFYAVAVGLLIAPLLTRWFPLLERPKSHRALGYLGIGLLLAMGIFGIARMAGYYPWP